MEEISQVDTYYNELMKSDNPAGVLVRFYEYSFHLPFSVSHAKTFGRLLHLYSRKEVFLALLDIFAYTEVAPEDHLLQSISYQIKKKYENLPEPPKYFCKLSKLLCVFCSILPNILILSVI